jgi:DNA-binding GntR family transcriptional regulator
MDQQVCLYLRQELARNAGSGKTKQVRLRDSIASAIGSRLLKPGDKLLPEQALSAAVGLSLGTVQKALADLATEGRLVREQGRGTFVARTDPPLSDIWQYRFVDRPGGELLPVHLELIDREKAASSDVWTNRLTHKQSDDDLYQLRRRVIVNRTFLCVSKFYVALSRFPSLPRIGKTKLNLNFKVMLSEEFGATTDTLQQFVEVGGFPDDVCKLLNMPRGSSGITLHSLGLLHNGDVISYQYLAIPSGPYLFEIPQARRLGLAS